jgi:hypothetical protein
LGAKLAVQHTCPGYVRPPIADEYFARQ